MAYNLRSGSALPNPDGGNPSNQLTGDSPVTQPQDPRIVLETPPAGLAMTPEMAAWVNELVAQQVRTAITALPATAPAGPAQPILKKPLLKAIVPQEYKGKTHQELNEFLRQCHEHFRVVGINNDEPEALAFVGSLIRGTTAGMQWKQHCDRQPFGHVFTWLELKKKLRQFLGDEHTFVTKTWRQYFSYHQRTGESVSAFAQTLWDSKILLEEYNPTCAPNEGQLVKRLLDGMRSDVRAELETASKHVEYYEPFLSLAVEAESIANLRTVDKGSSATKRTRSRDGSPSHSAPKGKGRDRGRDHGKKPRPEQGSTPATGANADEPALKCYTCGKPGHKANNPICEKYDKVKYENKAKSTN